MDKSEGIGKTKATIIDVAKHAEVAVSTVSRVINNRSDVKEKTRNKVVNAMKELNYIPSNAARTLGRGGSEYSDIKATNNVGLFVPQDLMSIQYFIDILKGVESELTENGMNCVFNQIKGESLQKGTGINEYNLLKLLMDRRFDGIIAVNVQNKQVIDLFGNINLPLVFIDSLNLEDEYSYIKSDNIGGARKAVSYLASLGHKRIALIRDNKSSWFFDEVEQGYKMALIENDIAFDPNLVMKGGENYEAGYIQTKKLLESIGPPTAIFTNDITAIGVVNAIKEKGLGIPGDISVIGFDDIEVTLYMDPLLTTVHVPKNEMGVFAAKTIIECIINEEPSTPMVTSLSTKLIVRHSTGICRR